ncbi:hypothetical protein [Mycoplasmopsis sturni]|uniref:hypothetical protein n=1 Tax=Mycoplasmopsis sturni TaxID=39047 RepID=UPI0012EB3CB5|nr:hypothetical protein [Mycoplasmopsis sturni]
MKKQENNNQEKLLRIISQLNFFVKDWKIKQLLFNKRKFQKILILVLINSSFLWFFLNEKNRIFNINLEIYFELIEILKKQKSSILIRHFLKIFFKDPLIKEINGRIISFLNFSDSIVERYYKYTQNILDFSNVYWKFNSQEELKKFLGNS